MDKYELILTYGYKALTPPSVTYSTGDVTPPANSTAQEKKQNQAQSWA